MSADKLDSALREICEKGLSQGAENKKYSDEIINHLVSLGYITSHDSGVWQKVQPTEAGKAFLAAGGFAALYEKELAQKRQDDFLELQCKFMNFQREMLEEQHRYNIEQSKKMLLVARWTAFATFLSGAAALAQLLF